MYAYFYVVVKSPCTKKETASLCKQTPVNFHSLEYGVLYVFRV